VWNACVVDTVHLVRELQGMTRTDWRAVAAALLFYGWTVRGFGAPVASAPIFDGGPFLTARTASAVDALRERIRDTYRRTVARAAASKRIKPAFKRIKPAFKT
jgi:hypothetical protein